MDTKPETRHFAGATLLLLLVAAAMAMFIILTASMARIEGLSFGPIFVIYAVLYVPAGIRRLAEAFCLGPGGRARMIATRKAYLDAVLEHPKLRAWPENTFSCITAASALLAKASFRAWIILMGALILSKLFGQELRSDLQAMWGIFTCVEVVLLGTRAYQRGTLPLSGMGAAEMERYSRDRIDQARDGYLSPGP